MKPFLIGIDGPDGVGKSTLVKNMQERIETMGLSADVIHVIKHSSAGAIYYKDYVEGQLDPIREACGMLYSVMDSIHTAIQEAEDCGTDVVIFDRTLYSILSYQLYVNGYYWFESVLKQCFSQANFPHIYTILLDTDPRLAFDRMVARGNLDTIESRGAEYQTRINAAYRRAAHEHRHLMGRRMAVGEDPHFNVDHLTVEQVANSVMSMVNPLLQKRIDQLDRS